MTLPEKTINDIIKEMKESAELDPTTNTNQQKEEPNGSVRFTSRV